MPEYMTQEEIRQKVIDRIFNDRLKATVANFDPNTDGMNSTVRPGITAPIMDPMQNDRSLAVQRFINNNKQPVGGVRYNDNYTVPNATRVEQASEYIPLTPDGDKIVMLPGGIMAQRNPVAGKPASMQDISKTSLLDVSKTSLLDRTRQALVDAYSKPPNAQQLGQGLVSQMTGWGDPTSDPESSTRGMQAFAGQVAQQSAQEQAEEQARYIRYLTQKAAWERSQAQIASREKMQGVDDARLDEQNAYNIEQDRVAADRLAAQEEYDRKLEIAKLLEPEIKGSSSTGYQKFTPFFNAYDVESGQPNLESGRSFGPGEEVIAPSTTTRIPPNWPKPYVSDGRLWEAEDLNNDGRVQPGEWVDKGPSKATTKKETDTLAPTFTVNEDGNFVRETTNKNGNVTYTPLKKKDIEVKPIYDSINKEYKTIMDQAWNKDPLGIRGDIVQPAYSTTGVAGGPLDTEQLSLDLENAVLTAVGIQLGISDKAIIRQSNLYKSMYEATASKARVPVYDANYLGASDIVSKHNYLITDEANAELQQYYLELVNSGVSKVEAEQVITSVIKGL